MRRLLGLAAAGLVGIGAPAWRAATGPADPLPDQVGPADAALSAWRGELSRPGAAVVIGLDEDPRRSAAASARAFVAAYALAPAVVTPVVLAGCREAGPEACGLAGAPAVILCDGAVGRAMGLAIRLGLTRVDAAGGCVLLRRPAP